MGDRANYAVIQDGQTSLYYSSWGAGSIPHELFFGPEFALRWFEYREKTDGLMSAIGCNGAVIVDQDKRRLLFFVSDLRYRPGLRRYFLPLLGHNWPGWEVRWADQGLIDLAIYLGIDPDESRDRHMEQDFKATKLGSTPEFDLSLITMKTQDSAIDYGFEEFLTEILAWGPGLINQLPGRPEAGLLDVKDIESGALLDPARREMWVWFDFTEDDRVVDKIADFWPGWTVRRHNGGLWKHVDLSGRDATRLAIDEAEAIRTIVALLSENETFDPSKVLSGISGDGSTADAQVEHGFFKADRADLDAGAKEEILRRSIAALRSGEVRPNPMGESGPGCRP